MRIDSVSNLERPRSSTIRIRQICVRIATVAATLTLLLQATVFGVDREDVEAARDLYGAARYEEALQLLDRLKVAGALAPKDLLAVEQHRAFCLLALGRPAEADEAFGLLIRKDPFYALEETDASPRVRAAYRDLRRRLLPDLVTEAYRDAKTAFDGKDFAAAVDRFRRVLALLEDPDVRERPGDLRTLATGFLELSVAAAARPEPPPAPIVPEPAPVVLEPVYSVDDRDVTAPVVIRQDVPPAPQNLRMLTRLAGRLEVVISAQGRVEGIVVLDSINPTYDPLLVSAAMNWQYRPAMRAGSPVKFRKLIQVTLHPPKR